MLFSLYNENEPFLVNDDDNSTNVRYITGEIKNKKLCAGFCNSDSHPGYMTQKMVDKHRCHEKQCAFFYEEYKNISNSAKKTAFRGNDVRNGLKYFDEKEILKQCQTACRNLDGVKIIRANRDNNNNWIFHYASVCSVDENLLRRKIEMIIKTDFDVKKIECDFDVAERLVYQS